MPSASIIIPTYNGRHLLVQCLSSVVQAARAFSSRGNGSCQVAVVDDASTDDTDSWIQESYGDEVRYLRQEEHAGFIAAVNRGVANTEGDALVLLNNDVSVEPGFLDPLLDVLDERTFAVTAGSITSAGQNEGLSVAFFEQGDLIIVQPGVEMQDTLHDRRCTNFHASGGFSAFDRRKWLELGGLDPIYHPFYWEDVDICFRAWKRGWRCLYQPESRVHHHPHSTISCYFAPEQVKRTYEGNKHIFIMKNITDEALFAAYVRRLGRDLFNRPASPEERRRRWGAFELLRQARDAMAARGKQARSQSVYSDAEVLDLSANRAC